MFECGRVARFNVLILEQKAKDQKLGLCTIACTMLL